VKRGLGLAFAASLAFGTGALVAQDIGGPQIFEPITLCAGGKSQIREIRAGSNFESEDPAEAFFGIGAAGRVQELERVPGPTKSLPLRHLRNRAAAGPDGAERP
jgi:hypothetical protein